MTEKYITIGEIKEKYLSNLSYMLADIKESYDKEKDPLARCELAKGYLALGKELMEKRIGY
ncbi:hypothetical protein HZZ02_05765 [Streptococcus danieliae]|nr:hypothetical protein [Streptococcus danieliae]